MSLEQACLWVAVTAYVIATATGTFACMRWMGYSRNKNGRTVSMTLSVCVTAYGVAFASIETRLIAQGEIETAIKGLVATAICITALAALVKVTSLRSRR